MNRFRSFAQLVRLPNVFTAFADITLAALATHSLPDQWPYFLLLLVASGCLYCAGMVFNDVFDIGQDRKERPFRPLPSGRVSMRAAIILGKGLIVLGMFAAALAGAFGIAAMLVVAIFSYDGYLKRTVLGPIAMGTCRFLNVWLGLSLASIPSSKWPIVWTGILPTFSPGLWLALVVGVYIVGVTWFARTEARQSSVTALTLAATVMLVGLLLALPVPVVLEQEGMQPTPSPLFPFLLVGFGFWIGIPVCRAIARPEPALVQAAVKRSVLGLVALDAILATATAGTIGLVVLLLLPPALLLGRRLYST